MTFRVRAQRYTNFRNYKNCYIFVSKILRLLLCTGTYPRFNDNLSYFSEHRLQYYIYGITGNLINEAQKKIDFNRDLALYISSPVSRLQTMH